MIPALLVALGAVWIAVAVVAAVAIGMSIADADRHEGKSCCPHPEAEAPDTIRGQFRAVVVPATDHRGSRLDVKA